MTLPNASDSLPLLVLPSPMFFRRIRTSHSNITFSRIFPASEHYFFPRPPSLVIKLHTYLDRATQMYATGAWLMFPPSAWDAHPLASPLEIGALHLTSWNAGETSVTALCPPIKYFTHTLLFCGRWMCIDGYSNFWTNGQCYSDCNKSPDRKPPRRARFYSTPWRENAADWSLKRGALGRRGSCMNSLLSAATGHVRSPVATRIICTPVCSVSVLLRFRRRMAYWSPSAKEMSDLVRPVSANVAFFASAAV